MFLQETWLPQHESNIPSNDFTLYNFHTTSSDMFIQVEDLILKSGPVWHGTALGWQKSLDKFITKLPVVSERFCGVKYVDLQSDINLIAYTAYLPTSGQDEEFLEILALLGHDISEHNTKNSVVIIGTDSNVSSKSSKRRFEAMVHFLDTFSLKTLSENEEPTFHHNNQTSESQVDHIYVAIPETSKITMKFKTQLCLKDDSANISSHDVIIGEMEVPTTREKTFEENNVEYSPFIVKRPKWEKSGMENYQKQSAQILRELATNYCEVEFIPILCELFSKALVLSAEHSYDSTEPIHKKTDDKKNYPKFSKQYQEAHLKHKKVFAEWRVAGRPADFNHPAKAAVLASRRNIQKIARDEENDKSIKLHNDLIKTFNTDINNISNKLKKARGQTLKKQEISYLETMAGNYYGENVLEGFSANTEMLCNENETQDNNYDQKFYDMIIKDNMIIFDITSKEDLKIPHMNITQLKDIIFKKLKPNKACDVFKITVEHLRNAGDECLNLILCLLNSIIDNITVLSSSQLNTSIASVVFKGKDKPVYHHKSHRLVRVTPLFGRIIDTYMRPALIELVRPMQNCNQYGFTEKVSYLLGALQRHEVEKHCVDMKKTFIGCSLDGDSAFEVVNRQIQTRELYFAGESGQYWQASHFSYQDTLTNIKMDGKLSRNIKETLGVKQGRNKSSDHYKVYIAPLLDTLDHSQLGVWIGNINVSVSGVADDVYLMTDTQTKLQAQLDIASHYGNMYRIQYGASKTKVTIVGSEIDQKYFSDVEPWKMGGMKVKVVENNEHLGQIVSGISQEDKNVNARLTKGRKSLFGLLGAGFSFKCFLSPVLKLHIYRTYTCPITRSGLSTFALRTAQIEPLSLFQRKTLKAILKLSITAPTPSIHFLTGELPIEGKIHKDIFSLFFSVWSNPGTKIYEILVYLLRNSSENSRTWAIHLRHLCKRYGLEDPLTCLGRDPPERGNYKEYITTRITAYFENLLRQQASENSCMSYLNVATLGLRGRHHPALSDMVTTREVKLSRPHIKLLAGNYLTYKTKADQSGGSARCRICMTGEDETVSHVISTCLALKHQRDKILEEFKTLCKLTKNEIDFEKIMKNEDELCQFILDPSSLNLSKRVSLQDPLLAQFFRLSRDFCYIIDKTRIELLRRLENS